MDQKKSLGFGDGQVQQIIIGLVIIVVFWIISPPLVPSEQFPKSILSFSVEIWFWIALLIPFLHQIIIAPLWRWELLDQKLTSFFGNTKKAFLFFKIIFSFFFFPRLLIVLPLAILTRETMNPTVQLIGIILAIPLSIIIIYGMYSIKQYFGFNRAFGADHFFERYREMDKVDQGLFKYTNNAMYTFILAITWVPAIFLGSLPALMVGLYNHLFVWIHYIFIEKPDMEYIYN